MLSTTGIVFIVSCAVSALMLGIRLIEQMIGRSLFLSFLKPLNPTVQKNISRLSMFFLLMGYRVRYFLMRRLHRISFSVLKTVIENTAIRRQRILTALMGNVQKEKIVSAGEASPYLREISRFNQ